jgi:hypothetical protein
MQLVIEIRKVNDPRIAAFLRRSSMSDEARLRLFERWKGRTDLIYAVATIATATNAIVVGIAALIKLDESDRLAPLIVGVWVEPRFRRDGAAHRMVAALEEEMINQYRTVPMVLPLSLSGIRLAERAGLEINVTSLMRVPGNVPEQLE